MKRILLLVALFSTFTVMAQPGPGGSPDGSGGGGAPIDGGVSLLIAGAIGYGAKKVKESRQKKMESEKEK